MPLLTRLHDKLMPYLYRVVWERRGTAMVRIGTAYGGWWVPTEALVPGAVAFCAGVGEDASFDVGLVERGVRVWAFDPTPRAIAYAATLDQPADRFAFVPKGWWSEPSTLRFYAPADPAHVSHSVTNLQGTEEFFEAEVDTVARFVADLGVRPDLVKMDIEGAELAVIDSMLADGVLPGTLCVEFDQPCSARTIDGYRRRLRAVGYRLARIEHWNYTFVR